MYGSPNRRRIMVPPSCHHIGGPVELIGQYPIDLVGYARGGGGGRGRIPNARELYYRRQQLAAQRQLDREQAALDRGGMGGGMSRWDYQAAMQEAYQRGLSEGTVNGCPPDAQVVQIRERQYTTPRVFGLGFGTTTIPASTGPVEVTVQPQKPFKGKRLIIPSNIGGVIQVHDIKIGTESQLVSNDSMPGLAFAENAVDIELNLETAQVSQDVSLFVSNTSLSDVDFTAVLKGVTVE